VVSFCLWHSALEMKVFPSQLQFFEGFLDFTTGLIFSHFRSIREHYENKAVIADEGELVVF